MEKSKLDNALSRDAVARNEVSSEHWLSQFYMHTECCASAAAAVAVATTLNS